MKIQRCTLFSVTGDRKQVILEAGFPEAQHGIGKIFSVKEPFIQVLLSQNGPYGALRTRRFIPPTS